MPFFARKGSARIIVRPGRRQNTLTLTGILLLAGVAGAYLLLSGIFTPRQQPALPHTCLLYTSPGPRAKGEEGMPD